MSWLSEPNLQMQRATSFSLGESVGYEATGDSADGEGESHYVEEQVHHVGLSGKATTRQSYAG